MKTIKQIHEELVNWTTEWFNKNSSEGVAVIGMSGGKDSTVAAAVLVEALGSDRVLGVMMPDEGQGLNDAEEICKYLGITCINCPIGAPVAAVNSVVAKHLGVTSQTSQNIPPRIRMTMLYAIAQSVKNGRVINTCNKSETSIGYETLWGDAVGDVSILGGLTVTQILALGDYMKLPKEWVHKTPDDGLPFSCPDEEKLGFTYENLDKALEGKIIDIPAEQLKKMYLRNYNSEFKRNIVNIPTYLP